MARVRLHALVDGVALLAFVVIGTLSHDEALTFGRVAATTAPMVGIWFGVAAAVGLYRDDASPGRLLTTWALAVPLAAVARSVLGGGPWDERLAIFAAVALAFTAVFVLAGRAAVRAIAGGQRPLPSEPRRASSDVTS